MARQDEWEEVKLGLGQGASEQRAWHGQVCRAKGQLWRQGGQRSNLTRTLLAWEVSVP